MRYLHYLFLALGIDALLLPLLVLTMGWHAAVGYVVAVTPLSLWSARLIVALARGRITRRLPMLDGGPTMAGMFWSVRPEVYVRRPGFDHYKGYLVKEALCCAFLWCLLLVVPIGTLLERGAVVSP